MKLPSELRPYSFGGGEKLSKYQNILWPDIFRPEDSNYFSNIKEIGKAGGLSAYELSGYNKLNGRDANRGVPVESRGANATTFSAMLRQDGCRTG